MIDLPLFPLSTVLFPSGTLPLHIFEERYKLMIGHCIEEQSPFGAVLIKSGREVGGPAEPHSIGTTARIARVQQLSGGRMNLIAVGAERFRIDEFTQQQPYLRARAEILQDIDGDGRASASYGEEVATLYAEYYRLVLALTNQWQERVGLPQRPQSLADFVATRLEADAEQKQRLLEVLSIGERLALERGMLREAIGQLEAQLHAARQQKYGGLGALN